MAFGFTHIAAWMLDVLQSSFTWIDEISLRDVILIGGLIAFCTITFFFSAVLAIGSFLWRLLSSVLYPIWSSLRKRTSFLDSAWLSVKMRLPLYWRWSSRAELGVDYLQALYMRDKAYGSIIAVRKKTKAAIADSIEDRKSHARLWNVQVKSRAFIFDNNQRSTDWDARLHSLLSPAIQTFLDDFASKLAVHLHKLLPEMYDSGVDRFDNEVALLIAHTAILTDLIPLLNTTLLQLEDRWAHSHSSLDREMIRTWIDDVFKPGLTTWMETIDLPGQMVPPTQTASAWEEASSGRIMSPTTSLNTGSLLHPASSSTVKKEPTLLSVLPQTASTIGLTKDVLPPSTPIQYAAPTMLFPPSPTVAAEMSGSDAISEPAVRSVSPSMQRRSTTVSFNDPLSDVETDSETSAAPTSPPIFSNSGNTQVTVASEALS
ncbi:hypothetical protein CPB85DRAFT_1344518 [Mucidula mucida]|nr:hypothetical protein CPB85DRAFT_1344518 [Mucidula mucida]